MRKKYVKSDCVISQHIQSTHQTSQVELNLAVLCFCGVIPP